MKICSRILKNGIELKNEYNTKNLVESANEIAGYVLHPAYNQ
jgi:hypothetical protein